MRIAKNTNKNKQSPLIISLLNYQFSSISPGKLKIIILLKFAKTLTKNSKTISTIPFIIIYHLKVAQTQEALYSIITFPFYFHIILTLCQIFSISSFWRLLHPSLINHNVSAIFYIFTNIHYKFGIHHTNISSSI